MDVRHAQSVAATHFFGLFDGHAGGRCSKHISSILPDVLTEDSLFLTNLPLALKRAFHTANDIFLRIAEQQRLHDGSTGICALVRNSKLLVGNVGDCRALLLSAGKTIQMSIDQKPTNPEEQKRIASLGGVITNNLGVTRVNGVLAVSRAFGNRKLRKVIRPDIEMMQRELTREDDFLVMASDGLWDVLRNKDVCDMCYGLASSCRPQQIADELVQTAMSRGSMDNVTCIVIKLGDYVSRALSKENFHLGGLGDGGTVTMANSSTPKSVTPTSFTQSPSPSPLTFAGAEQAHGLQQQQQHQQQHQQHQQAPHIVVPKPFFHRIRERVSGDHFESFDPVGVVKVGGGGAVAGNGNYQRGGGNRGPGGTNGGGNTKVAPIGTLPGGGPGAAARKGGPSNPALSASASGPVGGVASVSPSFGRPWTGSAPTVAGLLPATATGFGHQSKMVVSPSPSPSQLFVPLPAAGQAFGANGGAGRGSTREDRSSRDSRDEADLAPAPAPAPASVLMRPSPISAQDLVKTVPLVGRPSVVASFDASSLFVTPDPRSGFVSPKEMNMTRGGGFDDKSSNMRASSASAASVRHQLRDQQLQLQHQQQQMLGGGLPGAQGKLGGMPISRTGSYDSATQQKRGGLPVVARDSPSMFSENDGGYKLQAPPRAQSFGEDLYLAGAGGGAGGGGAQGTMRPLHSPIAYISTGAAPSSTEKSNSSSSGLVGVRSSGRRSVPTIRSHGSGF
jgi:hypothetical protein